MFKKEEKFRKIVLTTGLPFDILLERPFTGKGEKRNEPGDCRHHLVTSG